MQNAVAVSGRFVFDFETDDEVERIVAPNGTTINGLNYLLEVAFRGGPQKTTWCMSFIHGAPTFSGLTSHDNDASHVGWTENTFASPVAGIRPAWDTSATPPVGGRLEGAAFTIVNTLLVAQVIRGAFLTCNPAMAVVSGDPSIFCTAIMAADRTVNAGSSVTFTYGIILQPRS